MIERFFDGEILGIVAGIFRFHREGECTESLQAHKLKFELGAVIQRP